MLGDSNIPVCGFAALKPLRNRQKRSIYIVMGNDVDPTGMEAGRKTVLVVLFVPSVERDGLTEINQDYWVTESLETLDALFGGATAFPKARGVWRDDEMGGILIKDEPVVLHCYTTPELIEDPVLLSKLGSFCRRMGREARQGEIGLVIGDEYLAFRDYTDG